MGLAEARKAARTALLGVQVNDADPAAAKRARRNAETFDKLADRSSRIYAKPHKRSWRDDARQIRLACVARVEGTRGGRHHPGRRSAICSARLRRFAAA